SSRRRHTRFSRDWSSDVCSSDLDHLLGRERLPATQLDLTMHPQHRAAVGRGADRHHPVQPTGARPRGDRPHLQGITGGGPDLGPQSWGSGRKEAGCAGGHRRLPYTRAPMRASTDRMRPAGAAETTGAMTTIDTTAAIAMGQIRTWPRITRNPPYAKSTATVAHRRAKRTASAVPGSGQASSCGSSPGAPHTRRSNTPMRWMAPWTNSTTPTKRGSECSRRVEASEAVWAVRFIPATYGPNSLVGQAKRSRP